MKKQEYKSDKTYSNLRIAGPQPAILKGLAEVLKNETILRPDLSFCGSSYHMQNKILILFWKRSNGANIGTSALDAREKF